MHASIPSQRPLQQPDPRAEEDTEGRRKVIVILLVPSVVLEAPLSRQSSLCLFERFSARISNTCRYSI